MGEPLGLVACRCIGCALNGVINRVVYLKVSHGVKGPELPGSAKQKG